MTWKGRDSKLDAFLLLFFFHSLLLKKSNKQQKRKEHYKFKRQFIRRGAFMLQHTG
jgi:hypothetical protein